MEEELFDTTKEGVLAHIEALFQEMEEDMAVSHQEKYAMLEDAFDQATDVDELRVAFEQWYAEHSDELNLELEPDELWDVAIGGRSDDDDEEDV